MRAAAIYARVSTPRQGREQTIESQLDTLKSWANENGHELAPENIHADEGYSGSRLDRPGLDALRDGAEDGAFEVVGVLSPDRLARKYAYQVLLLEELGRAGCEVMFLHHPISEDPNDQLLLQIQGAIAEYERAMIAERFRRGKLQKAREGHFIGGKAPYGYRYIPKRDGVPGHLAIDETEAEMVRTLFGWLVEERMSIRQITKRLNEGSWYPRSGKHPWSPSTVHSILSHPIHAGTTYANRYRYVAPEKPQGRRARSGENTCRVERPREEWIPIPAPAIVDEDTHRRAQDQLERNAELSFRNNKKYSYLLRCPAHLRELRVGHARGYQQISSSGHAPLLPVRREEPHLQRPRAQMPPDISQDRGAGRGCLGSRKRAHGGPQAARGAVRELCQPRLGGSGEGACRSKGSGGPPEAARQGGRPLDRRLPGGDHKPQGVERTQREARRAPQGTRRPTRAAGTSAAPDGAGSRDDKRSPGLLRAD